MRSIIVAFAVGLIFAVGLGLAGMTRPDKVLGFLDVTGAWDPSLAWVMAGATAVFALAWRLRLGRRTPLWGKDFPDLSSRRIDARLVGGAALFGVGWGLAGYCPGPALVSLAAGAWPTFLFVACMLVGMSLVRLLVRG
jgi:uncharacterized membrane protein YedE/YeeE